MTLRRDIALALKARKHGAESSLRIIREARRAGVSVSWAFALVEQESGFRNIFGHDSGSILHGQRVTKRRVRRLIAHVKQGGVSNGVGLTQLTSIEFILAAERLGGAHLVKNQLRVGFEFFASLGDPDQCAWRYNGQRQYQAQVKARQHAWHSVLT